MALFGGKRDISLFHKINNEFMKNIVSQQCIYYQHNLEKSKTNIYGEAEDDKRIFNEPIILFCLVERSTPEHFSEQDLGIDFKWDVNFKFLRKDLVEANLLPQIGDIIRYNESFFEIDKIIENQYFVGKNPDYPNTPNPLNPGLENFGNSLSIVCYTHITPSDKFNIEKIRL